MLLLRLALRNLLRHPTKTFLIGSLIAAGVGFLFCANAVFESTSRGLETSFIGSLTGDFAVGAQGEESFGLFGSEVPIVSEYESIPAIADFASVSAVLSADPNISRWTPIVSAAAQVNVGGYVLKVPVFGVDGPSYFRLCSDILVDRGNVAALNSGGVFLNASLAHNAEVALGRTLKIGEPVVFSMYSKGTFRVRRGAFAGVHRYPAPTEALDRVVLADPVIVRALCDYTLGYAASSDAGQDKSIELGTIDDLFADAKDIPAAANNALKLTDIETFLSDTARRDSLVMTNSAAWSFVLSRVATDRDVDSVRREIASALDAQKVEARVLDWRTAAGASALMLFAVRAAFNVGVGFLILGATLVVMNALVISVLERTGEIGSMRALGASRAFIRSLFVLETMLLTLASSAVGVALGVLVSSFLARRGVPLSNPLLISLFGGSVVRPIVLFGSILTHLAGAAIIGSLAWIYPVSLALKIQPVSAMAER